MSINLRNLENKESEFRKLYEWCSNEYVYEWFEQRKLSLEEIREKYINKLNLGKQELFIIQYDNKDIGLVQIYKLEDSIKELSNYNNIYEYDLFIGEKEYLNKGIGAIIVNYINNLLKNNYNADVLVLRPFKNNIRAIKCYQKAGFKIINEYEDTDTVGNKEIISVLVKGV